VPTPRAGRYRESLLALQDAQKTMGLVRFHGAEWILIAQNGIDRFSAGGHMVTAMSTHFENDRIRLWMR